MGRSNTEVAQAGDNRLGILDVKGAARFTGLSRSTILRFLREGVLKRYRIADTDRTFVRVSDLEKLVHPE